MDDCIIDGNGKRTLVDVKTVDGKIKIIKHIPDRSDTGTKLFQVYLVWLLCEVVGNTAKRLGDTGETLYEEGKKGFVGNSGYHLRWKAGDKSNDSSEANKRGKAQRKKYITKREDMKIGTAKAVNTNHKQIQHKLYWLAFSMKHKNYPEGIGTVHMRQSKDVCHKGPTPGELNFYTL
uniref:Uncharacterized protein n=1 Tax=Timema cristinae TaxID=61476 RepID=A0A7R9GR48_TIMCR|nr:unnamed protein product [Timema cristinae]